MFTFTSASTIEDLFMSVPPRPLAVEAVAAWQAYKVAKGCAICGYRDSAPALTAEHVDPATALRTRTGKRVLPADAMKAGRGGFTRYSWATVCQDLAGCVILCANHAAERTERQRQSAEADEAYIDRYGLRSWLAWSAGDARGGF